MLDNYELKLLRKETGYDTIKLIMAKNLTPEEILERINIVIEDIDQQLDLIDKR